MLHFDRLSRAWHPALANRPSTDRIRLLPAFASAALGLLLVLAVGTGLLVSSRLAAVENEAVPALHDTRELRDLLDATREAVQGTDLAGDVLRLSRADSLAERFHMVATEARLRERHAPAMRAVDERFALYYVQARRAAQQLPSGDDAQTSSAELALVGRHAVRGMLDADIAATERAIHDELSSVQRLQLAGWVVMTLVVVAASILLLSLGGAIDDSMNEPMKRAAAAARSVADGESHLEVPRSDDINERSLHQALQRIAQARQDNAARAEALAEGRYHGVAGGVRCDRIGSALARIADYEEELSTVARRIAAGDLTAAVEPRSEHDRLGLSHGEMVGALTKLLFEMDAARQEIAGAAERMQDAAGKLATGAAEGAEGMRRSADSLSRMTHEVQDVAIRAQSMEGRVAESAATMEEGTAVLHESVGALQAVRREVSVVESLAEDAGLLALNAAIEAARAGDEGIGFTVVAEEVRLLAQQAGAAAREMSALTAAGAASATRSTELLGRLSPSIDVGAALVRELTVSSRQQATALMAIEGEMAAVNESTRRTASTAQQLATAADALGAHAARLGGVLRQFRLRTAEDARLVLAGA